MSTTEIDRNSRPLASRYVGSQKQGRKYGSRSPDHKPEPAPYPEYELEERVFCTRLGCWVLPKREEVPAQARPSGGEYRPMSDGSGVFWDVVDMSTGHRLWTIEAVDFDGALIEKRRLCRVHGASGKRAKILTRP